MCFRALRPTRLHTRVVSDKHMASEEALALIAECQAAPKHGMNAKRLIIQAAMAADEAPPPPPPSAGERNGPAALSQRVCSTLP